MKKVKSVAKLPAQKAVRKFSPVAVVKTVEQSMKSDASHSSREKDK